MCVVLLSLLLHDVLKMTPLMCTEESHCETRGYQYPQQLLLPYSERLHTYILNESMSFPQTLHYMQHRTPALSVGIKMISMRRMLTRLSVKTMSEQKK